MHAAIVAGGLGTRAAANDGRPHSQGAAAGWRRADHFPPDACAAARGRDAGERACGPSGRSAAAGARARSRSARSGAADHCRAEAARNRGLSRPRSTRRTEETLIVYGDMLFDIALAPLWEFHRRYRRAADRRRASERSPAHFGLDRRKRRTGEHNPAARTGRAETIIAIWCRPASISPRPHFFASSSSGVKADMISDVLPALVARGDADCRLQHARIFARRRQPRPAIASPSAISLPVGWRRSTVPILRPAIFFDCDGVLNEEPGLTAP